MLVSVDAVLVLNADDAFARLRLSGPGFFVCFLAVSTPEVS